MTTSGGWEPGGVRGFQRGVTLHPFGRLPGETGNLHLPGESGMLLRVRLAGRHRPIPQHLCE